MIILGIETSCDDTAVSVYTPGKVLSNVVHSQHDVHRIYGGIMPEMASRNHIANIGLVYQQALDKASIVAKDIDIIAYTSQPGLKGSLIVGSSFAKGLAYALKKPLMPIDHIEAHMLSPLIDTPINFPFLSLVVTGGNTQINLVKGVDDYELLGQTIDDAAGEVFDKIARHLSLPYPGGPSIEKLAATTEDFYRFDIPMRQGLNFSFSGLKSAAIRAFSSGISAPFIAKGLQTVIVKTLIHKVLSAVEITEVNEVSVVGGVSSNLFLRESFSSQESLVVHYPAMQYCCDNAAMVAFLAYLKIKNNFDMDLSIVCKSRR